MINRKTELVLITYELLKTTSLNNLTVRTIAEAAHCTSSAIYKHFEDFDQLLMFAAVRFLEDYIMELQEIVEEDADPIRMNDAMWAAFAKYAFANVDVYEVLFFGKYKGCLSRIIYDYYQLFPEEKSRKVFSRFMFSSYFGKADMEERVAAAMYQAAISGRLAYDDVRLFSSIQCHMFHSLLLEYKSVCHEPGKAEEGARLFMDMLYSLDAHYCHEAS